VGTGFPKRSCSNKKLEWDDDSKTSHHALAQLVVFAQSLLDNGGSRLSGLGITIFDNDGNLPIGNGSRVPGRHDHDRCHAIAAVAFPYLAENERGQFLFCQKNFGHQCRTG